jgi:hypothetical protein
MRLSLSEAILEEQREVLLIVFALGLIFCWFSPNTGYVRLFVVFLFRMLAHVSATAAGYRGYLHFAATE